MTKRRSLPVLVERSLDEAAAARQQAMFDFEQTLRSQGSVSCRKGCDNCCYHPVLISVLEGVQLYRWLSEHGIWGNQLKAAFQYHQEMTWGLAIEVWLLSMRPCPLLKDGVCSAYAGRPLSCRATFSVGDPYECHPHQFTAAQGIVAKRDLFEKVAKLESRVLQRHDLKYLRVPLSAAVLLGEQIDKGELGLDEAYEYIVQQTLKQHEDEA